MTETETELTFGEHLKKLELAEVSELCANFGLIYTPQLNHEPTLDAIRFRFKTYCETLPDCLARCRTLHDAFAKYADRFHFIHRKCWTSGFQGSTDYTVDGKRYSACWMKDKKMAWNGNYFEEELVYQVGTIFRYYGMHEGFPPLDVSCFFFELVPMRAQHEDAAGNPCHYNDPGTIWKHYYDDRFGKPKQRWGPTSAYSNYLMAELYHSGEGCDWDTDVKFQYAQKHFRNR